MTKLKTKPNGIYYLDTEVPDETGQLRRARISLDTRDPVEANNHRRDWIAGVHPKHPSRGAVVAAKGRRKSSTSQTVSQGVTMGKLLDMCESDRRCWKDLKSQATIRSNVALLTKRIGHEPVADMTHTRLCQLVDEMLDEGYKPASVKRKMDMVSKALRMAAETYEDADGAPLLRIKPKMPKIDFENEKDRVLSTTEEQLVFAAIDKRMVEEPGRQWLRFRMFIRLLIDTGFRRGEALSLSASSVHMIATGGELVPHLHLPKTVTKNKKARTIPATPAVASMFDTLNAMAVGGKWFPLGASAWYMWTNVRADVKAMGGDIDDVGLHTMRHTCATRLAKGGMKLHRLSIWLGHSDVVITAKRYAHLDTDDLQGGIAILSNPATSVIEAPFPELSAMWNCQADGGNRANVGTGTLQ